MIMKMDRADRIAAMQKAANDFAKAKNMIMHFMKRTGTGIPYILPPLSRPRRACVAVIPSIF